MTTPGFSENIKGMAQYQKDIKRKDDLLRDCSAVIMAGASLGYTDMEKDCLDRISEELKE